MFSRSKEELASIEDGQNSRVEKEVLLRSGWYDCVLSLVVLCLWDAKLMIVFALVVGKNIRRFKRGWKFPAVAHSQNTGIRWRGGPYIFSTFISIFIFTFLYIYIYLFSCPIWFLFESEHYSVKLGLSANFLRLILLIWLSPIIVVMRRCCLQRSVVWLHSSKKQSLF